jgi:plasmid stabilization system protein ParE
VLEILEAAADEMAEAAAYYEEHRTGMGRRFLDRVQAAVDRIERFPGIGRPYSPRYPEIRQHATKGFPYYVVYVTEPVLTVIGVAHMKRRPGYWMARVPR